MSSLIITSHLPSSAIVPPLSSDSKHVLSKRAVEVPSNISGNHTFDTNSRLEFDINSPSSFVDFLQSYIRFDLTTTLSFEGVTDGSRYLSEGGAHALFKTIEVSSAAGVRIARMEAYNRWYSIMSSAIHSREYVERALVREADGADGYSQTSGYVSPDGYAVTGTAFAWDSTGGASELLLTGTASTFLTDLRVKDIVVIEDANLESHIGVVESILTNTTATVAFSKTGDVTIAGNFLRVLKPQAKSVRNLIAVTANSSICFQPAVPFLQMQEWLPLFLIRGGIKVRLDLERPEMVLCSPQHLISTGWTNASYTITNANYVCQYIQPDQSLSEAYLQMYRGSGLAYHFQNVAHQMDVFTSVAARKNIVMNVGVRSARTLMCRIQNQRGQSTTDATVNGGKSTFTCDSIAQGIKGNLSYWQVESGSERYPLSGPIDTTSIDNSELQVELQQCFQAMGSSLATPRYLPCQWEEVASSVEPFEQGVVPTGRADSDRLIISANLARSDSPFAGLDLSLNSLNIQPTFDASYSLFDDDGTSNEAASASLYWLSFLGYDSTMLLQSDSGMRLFS